jgi:hypothetical protein
VLDPPYEERQTAEKTAIHHQPLENVKMMLEAKILSLNVGHNRSVCPECFKILSECPCGGDQRRTTWELCDICMKREPEAAKFADNIPEGTLLDARLVFRKILPILNFPKEFIPARLHPGYDQWKETLIQDILLSSVTKNSGESHERRERAGVSHAEGNDPGGTGGRSGGSTAEAHRTNQDQ